MSEQDYLDAIEVALEEMMPLSEALMFPDEESAVDLATLRAAYEAAGQKATLAYDEYRAYCETSGVRRCRLCECSEEIACWSPRTWVEPDLCSRCVPVSRVPDSGGVTA